MTLRRKGPHLDAPVNFLGWPIHEKEYGEVFVGLWVKTSASLQDPVSHPHPLKWWDFQLAVGVNVKTSLCVMVQESVGESGLWGGCEP